MTDFTGQYFDRYHILSPLGEGGMASVYKAYDTRLERDVAVKIIRTDMFIPAMLEKVMKRFEREAKSLARLSHPNIVSVIDYGEHEGVPYLVMEYLPGGSLKDRMTGQPMPWQEAFRLVLPVARALLFSHRQGIIHRDVKPSNILVTLSGEPMLSDFGIARILESEGSTALTGTGVGIGTPEYMAPEQWVGNTSPRSDLYSLGVVVYEMLTGRKPYTAETPAAILLKQANDPLPRPTKYVSDLPDRVEKVVLKVLAKKPEDRYPGMEEFITALETLLSGQAKTRPAGFWGDKRGAGQDMATVLNRVEDRPAEASRPLDAEKPADLALQEAESGRTAAAPVAPAPLLKKVPAIPEYPAGKDLAARPGAALLAKIKSHPIWAIAAIGLVGLVTVIALAFLARQRLAARPAAAAMGAGVFYYTSDQGGKAEIWFLDSKAAAHRVTQSPGRGQSWSPVAASGGIVYYTSDQSGKAEIFFLDSKAVSHQVTQTRGVYRSWSPAPSAGGNVYYTSDQSGKAEIYFLDGKAVSHQVTQTRGLYQSWSPVPASGGIVYYTSDQSGKAEIYYLDPKAVSHQVTQTPGNYQSWSPVPAGGGIVYYTSDQSGKAEIYYLDSKAVSHQVTQTPGKYQSWSPVPASGGIVYYTSDQSGKAELYYLDSKAVSHRVTQTPGKYQSWSKRLPIPSLGE